MHMTDPAHWIARYNTVRQRSMALAAPLSDEDCGAQSMPDASPIKWHLAHTTWFFETFILERMEAGFAPFHPAFRVLFNSYYNGIGEKHPRPQRGLLTRPALADVQAYRANVDARMARVLAAELDPALRAQLEMLATLGLEHEQQHQELMLTDVKHLLAQNPLYPAYLAADRKAGQAAAVPSARPAAPAPAQAALPPAVAVVGGDGQGEDGEGAPDAADAPGDAPDWIAFDGGLTEIGHGGDGFCFDNELPRHRQYVAPFALAAHLVSNRDYLAFIEAGGYRTPALWLAEGWDWVCNLGLRKPMYWLQDEASGQWQEFTLHGMQALDPDSPATHLSLFEADAYAHWRGARLPTEGEWEFAARHVAVETGGLHPAAARDGCRQGTDPGVAVGAAAGAGGDEAGGEDNGAGRLRQMFGHCWQWTSSSYAPYPGYETAPGALGEYNGKFMLNQYVLRGSSCATPPGHARASYRNFFPAGARWQFSGIRLARR